MSRRVGLVALVFAYGVLSAGAQSANVHIPDNLALDIWTNVLDM